MKILLISDNLGIGGKERRLLELVKGLKKEKVHVELAIFSDLIEYEEVYSMDIPIHKFVRHPKKDPRVFTRFYRLCKALRPDIIHSWGTMPSIYAIPASVILGIKLVNATITDAPHNMKFFDVRRFRTWITYPFSARVLANSFAGLDSYNAPTHKSMCIHNGFDFRRIEQLPPVDKVRAQYGIKTPFLVGMVGAFEERKDYDTFLQAAVAVARQREDVSFICVGGGSLLEGARAGIPEDLKDRILFTGRISQVEALIQTMTIATLVSNKRYHGEGISNAILEYMALRKPVIATDCGGTKEIVAHGENGYLIQDQDSKALEAHLLELLDDPEKARKMGVLGFERVQAEFNLSFMTQKYMALYESVLEESTPGHQNLITAK